MFLTEVDFTEVNLSTFLTEVYYTDVLHATGFYLRKIQNNTAVRSIS